MDVLHVHVQVLGKVKRLWTIETLEDLLLRMTSNVLLQLFRDAKLSRTELTLKHRN